MKSTTKVSLARHSLHLMSGAAVSVMAAHGALAQTDDEIIVSATKREQTLQEVPIAVSVVDADTIEKAQIIDLIDLQSTVPSLRVTQLQNSSQTNFVIRGFGNGANNPGIESAVGVFIDGVFRSRSASSILDLPTLERVEVLRGPQSTLFGKNVSVGAISITTKKPSFEWEGDFNVTYGNLDAVRAKGTLSGPITDTLAFRVSGSTSNRDGTLTNLVTGDDNINERNRWSARAQLLWEPLDTLSFRAIGEYNQINEICCGAVQLVNAPTTLVIGDGVAIPSPLGTVTVPGLGEVVTPVQDLDARQVSLDTLPSNILEGRGGSLEANWDLGWAQLTSITAYREQTDFNDTDVDFSAAAVATQPQDQLSQTFTQELRISGYTETGFGDFNWIAGGFFFDEDLVFERDVIFDTQAREFIDTLVGLGGIAPTLGDPDFQQAVISGTVPVQSAFAPGGLTGFEGATQLGPILNALTGGPTALFPEFGSPALFGNSPVPIGASFAPGSGVFGDYTLDNRSYSLFGQVDWDVTDRLTITGGISYVNDRKIATGTSVLDDPVSNFDIPSFVQGGNALTAAGAFGQVADGTFAQINLGGGSTPLNPLTGNPFSGADFAFAPSAAGLTSFLTNAGALAAVDPTAFGLIRDGSSAAAAASPQLNALAPLGGLTAVQFFAPQFNFPVAGVTPDTDNSLVDDGFVVDDSVNYTARIAYDVLDSLNVYFSYATGFKASAVNLSSDSFPPTQATDANGTPLFDDDGNPVIVGRFASPEDVTTFEIGAKAQFPGGFINIALFDQEVDQFQINAFTGTAFALINAGTQDVKGFEVDAAYSPIDSLNFTFGITYLDPEITDFVNAPCSLFLGNPNCANGETTFDASGIRPAGVHEVSLSTSANYYKELNNGAAINARVEYVYESEVRVNDNTPEDLTRQVSVINANLGVAFENGFNVNLFGRNLTDDDFLLSTFPTVVQTGSFSGYVSEPRTYGITVGYEF